MSIVFTKIISSFADKMYLSNGIQSEDFFSCGVCLVYRECDKYSEDLMKWKEGVVFLFVSLYEEVPH